MNEYIDVTAILLMIIGIIIEISGLLQADMEMFVVGVFIWISSFFVLYANTRLQLNKKR